MGESTSSLLVTLMWAVFHQEYEIRVTPSALKSGTSQLVQIEREISKCAFAIVCLDGLRPNVICEYGYIRGRNVPTILLKKDQATVDVLSILGLSAPVGFKNPELDLNVHLSNLKDVHYAPWHPDDPAKSVKEIWDEYEKMREKHKDLVEVAEPRLW
jgi:hypothetical protein